MTQKWYAESSGQELTRSKVPAHINTSLNKSWVAEDVLPMGIYPIVETPRPSITALETVEPGDLTKIDNEYHRTWNVIPRFNTQEEIDTFLAEETVRQQQILIQHCEQAVTDLIQSEVDAYNTANNLVFADVHSCANYSVVDGYTHQAFCLAVWTWNVAVWEAARQALINALAGTITITSPEDLLALMPEFNYVP